jgi:acyl carrier protein
MTAGLSEADLRTVIGDVVGEAAARELTADQPFADFGLDSLDQAQILIRLDEGYGISIADADFEKCSSINNILNHVAGR